MKSTRRFRSVVPVAAEVAGAVAGSGEDFTNGRETYPLN